MCFDWHVRGDCRSDECLWEYGGSERLLLVQQGLLQAAPTPVMILLALFLYFYCCDDYFCCYYGLFQGVLHRVQSESHECSGEATKGFLGCVRFPYCNLKMRSLIYWLTSRQICSWSSVANKMQWLSLWFSLYERNAEQLQVKMQTPPACCSPPSSIFHISFFPSFLFICWWLLYLMHQSILKHVTDRKNHQQRDVRFENVYTQPNNPKLTNALLPFIFQRQLQCWVQHWAFGCKDPSGPTPVLSSHKGIADVSPCVKLDGNMNAFH